jgi:hypothetical protein
MLFALSRDSCSMYRMVLLMIWGGKTEIVGEKPVPVP